LFLPQAVSTPILQSIVHQGMMDMLGTRYSVTPADCDQVFSREWRKNIGLPKVDLMQWQLDQDCVIPFAPIRYNKQQGGKIQMWFQTHTVTFTTSKTLEFANYSKVFPWCTRRAQGS
jgi:hypothetical protein